MDKLKCICLKSWQLCVVVMVEKQIEVDKMENCKLWIYSLSHHINVSTDTRNNGRGKEKYKVQPAWAGFWTDIARGD